MYSAIEIIFSVLILLLSVPVITFFLQVVFALLPYKAKPNEGAASTSVVILIPAHNESTSLIPTLDSILGQVGD
ncbi:MAG: glycosyl transferase, partial [Methylophilaceae bacterium]